jgi:hypothetical protein
MSAMRVNEFMLDLAKKLREEKKVAESTATAYIRAMYLLNGKQPYKNLTFLKNTSAIADLVSKYAESTIKTIYASIVSVLSLFKDKPTYKKVYQHYYDLMMGKSEEAKKAETSDKTQKQTDNWITWDEVQKKVADLREKVAEFKSNKSITNQQYESLLHYLIVSLYTETQPRRNQDYLDMFVSKKQPTETEHNYVVLTKSKPTSFIFNKFKTSKKYGQQTLEVPETLSNVIAEYLKFHPLKKNATFKFLVSHDGTPITAVNAITRVLNKIFGKRVGSSMLRHIFLSTKYDIKEMEKDANAMGHSVEEQKKYMKGSGEVAQEVTVPTMDTIA